MKLICEICGKQFNGYKGQKFCSNVCKNKHFSITNKQKCIDKYLLNPKFCKHCGKLIPYPKRKNSFCSQSCANSYTNIHRERKPWSEEQRARIRKIYNRNSYCKYCGVVIEGSSLVCPNCKPYVYRLKTFIKFNLLNGPLQERYNKLKEIIYQDYFENHYSLSMIAESYGVDMDVIYKIINKEFGGCRSSSESVLLAIKEGRFDACLGLNSIKNYNFISGKHKSWDGKIYCYRSSWEDQYMIQLDEEKIPYQYEPFRVEYFDSKRNIIRYAVPDFLLINTNEIVEIKSSYTIKNHVQEMKDKFVAYQKLGYTPKLLLDWEFVDIRNISEEDF